MKFSYVMLPDYPLADSIETIKKADELGFHALLRGRRDVAQGHVAAVRRGRRQDDEHPLRARACPAIWLREPTLICQALATLDELTGGRAECVISIGNFGLLAQYHIDWTKIRPLSRVQEAHHVMRTFLDEGAITFEGEFYKYTGLFTFARPVQERLPLLLGAMRGPKSFELAGEVSDGVHHALSYSREAYEYLVEHVKIGAEKAGRDWQSLDIGAWCVFTFAPDSAEAKKAARHDRGLLPLRPCRTSSSSATASTPRRSSRSSRRSGRATSPGAIELTTPEIAETLSIAGTPEECVAKIREIVDTGVNHMILCITDARS